MATRTVIVPPNHGIPNHPTLPALVTPGAASGLSMETVKSRYRRNGWTGLWDWTVYDFHHYHPAAHEALTCVQGWADLRLGGPDGEIFSIETGDALILPAGFGHCRLASGDGFTVVGGYPEGQEVRDIVRAGERDIDEVLSCVAATPVPLADPLDGPDGPLARHWH